MDVCVFILNRVVSEGFHDEVGFEWRLKEEWGQPYLNLASQRSMFQIEKATGKGQR